MVTTKKVKPFVQKGRFSVFHNEEESNANSNPTSQQATSTKVNLKPKQNSQQATSTKASAHSKPKSQNATSTNARRQTPGRSKQIGRFTVRNTNSNNHDQLLTLICDLKKMLSKFSNPSCK
jgi:hypothetical protein